MEEEGNVSHEAARKKIVGDRDRDGDRVRDRETETERQTEEEEKKRAWRERSILGGYNARPFVSVFN